MLENRRRAPDGVASHAKSFSVVTVVTQKMLKAASIVLGGGWLLSSPPPVVYVNPQNELLAPWASEAVESSLPPECAAYNLSVIFDGSLCSHLTINRVGNVAAHAMRRAHRCAGQWGAACVLSPEVGFSVPAVFLYDYHHARMRTIVAPKLVALNEAEQVRSKEVYVRVSPPDSDGILGTRTVTFNDTVLVEYLNDDKKLVHEQLTGDDAFCVQLLRSAFDASCWRALD